MDVLAAQRPGTGRYSLNGCTNQGFLGAIESDIQVRPCSCGIGSAREITECLSVRAICHWTYGLRFDKARFLRARALESHRRLGEVEHDRMHVRWLRALRLPRLPRGDGPLPDARCAELVEVRGARRLALSVKPNPSRVQRASRLVAPPLAVPRGCPILDHDEPRALLGSSSQSAAAFYATGVRPVRRATSGF